MRLQRLIDLVVYLVVRVFICIVQAVTLETCQTVSRLLAWLACDVLRVRRHVIEDNLQHAFPELDAGQRTTLTRRMWEHLFLMVCEVAHIPRKIHDTNWRHYVTIREKRTLVRFLLESRPTLLVSGHFGNFELAGYICGLLGVPTYSIARKLDNPYLHDFVNRFRGRKGQFVLPKDGSSGQVETILSQNGTLALLGDQHAGIKGCWVDFMGRPASCHKGLALFSLGAGAPLLVSYARRVGGPLQFEIGLAGAADPADGGPEMAGVKPLTQWYNQRLERIIRMSPEQYWWVHRRWKDAPPRRGRQAASAPPPPASPDGVDPLAAKPEQHKPAA